MKHSALRIITLGASAIGFLLYLSWELFFDQHSSTSIAHLDGEIHYVSSPVNGLFNVLFVEENQKIERHQILVQLDDADIDYQIKVHGTDYTQAFEEKQRAFEEQQNWENIIDLSQQKITLLHNKVELVRQQHQRMMAIHAQGGASFDAVELPERELLRLQHKLLEEKSHFERASNQRLQAIQQQKIKQLRLIALSQALAELERLKSERVILSHVDGFVVKVHRHTGQFLSAGDILLTLLDRDALWVHAYFDERALPRLAAGQSVRVRFDALGRRDFVGVIDSVSAVAGAKQSPMQPNYTSGYVTRVVQRVPVRIKLEDVDERLVPGLSAKVWLMP